MSTRVILLDRMLAHYGPETKEVRDQLRASVAVNMDKIWPHERTQPSGLVAPVTASETLLAKIQELSPKDDKQRSLQAQALNITLDLMQTRWLMYEQGANTVSRPMLVILVFWLAAIFTSFGLFAPCNPTVVTALFVASLSVSGAIFLILEMYAPFGGMIQISSAPLRAALAHLGR